MGLSLKLLGGFAVCNEAGTELPLRTRKTRALLAYLTVNADSPQPRFRLMALLWSGRDERQARPSLNNALMAIRQLGNGRNNTLLVSDSENVTLNGSTIESDIGRFRALIKDDPAGAASLYDGPFLDGLSIPEPVFEGWLSATRLDLEAKVCDALLRAAEDAAAKKYLEQAFMLARRLEAIDPIREEAHRLLMRLMYERGDRVGALRQYQTCADILARELQVSPDSATQALLRHIRSDKSNATAVQDAEGSNMELLPLGERPSIAVLAFENLSGDPAQECFADGMAEDLITELSRFRWFYVIARNSSFAYKGQAIDVTNLARALRVKYIVEGSVRRAQERLRVAVQLIDGETGNHLWADRFDRKIGDVFELQSDIAQTIAARIEPELAENERLLSLRKPTRKLDAWNLYQRGRSEYLRSTKQTNIEAERLFREAIKVDPEFAAAHARLALVQQNNVFFGYTEDPAGLLDSALVSAKKAVALDIRDPLAHYTLGEVLIRKRDFKTAIPALTKAIDLNPSAAWAYYGLGLAMYYSGRCTEAIPQFKRALQLSPNAPTRWAYFHLQARCHLDLEQYEEAFECASRALRQPNANTIALAVFAAAAAYLGRVDQAQSAIEDLLRRQPDYSVRYVLEHFGNEFIAGAMEHFANGLRKAGLSE